MRLSAKVREFFKRICSTFSPLLAVRKMFQKGGTTAHNTQNLLLKCLSLGHLPKLLVHKQAPAFQNIIRNYLFFSKLFQYQKINLQ